MQMAAERFQRWLALLALACLAALLSGCAGMRIVDTDVRAFSADRGVEVPATYRFERLPTRTMEQPADTHRFTPQVTAGNSRMTGWS